MVQFISLKDIQDELFLCKDHFIFVVMEFIIVNGVYCLADSKMVE